MFASAANLHHPDLLVVDLFLKDAKHHMVVVITTMTAMT